MDYISWNNGLTTVTNNIGGNEVTIHTGSTSATLYNFRSQYSSLGDSTFLSHYNRAGVPANALPYIKTQFSCNADSNRLIVHFRLGYWMMMYNEQNASWKYEYVYSSTSDGSSVKIICCAFSGDGWGGTQTLSHTVLVNQPILRNINASPMYKLWTNSNPPTSLGKWETYLMGRVVGIYIYMWKSSSLRAVWGSAWGLSVKYSKTV